MRRRGKLGGQNKVPRVDNSGTLTLDLLAYLDETHQSGVSIPAGRVDGREGDEAASVTVQR